MMDSFELIVEILQGHGLYASGFFASLPYIHIYVNEAHIGTCDFFPKTITTWNDTYRCYISQIANILLTFKVYEVSVLGVHTLLGSSKIPFAPLLKNGLQWHSTNTTTISNYGEIEFRLTLQPKYLTRLKFLSVFHERNFVKALHSGCLQSALRQQDSLTSYFNDFASLFCPSSSVIISKLRYLMHNQNCAALQQPPVTVSGIISNIHSFTNAAPHTHTFELRSHTSTSCSFVSGLPLILHHDWNDAISIDHLSSSGLIFQINAIHDADCSKTIRKEYISYLSLYTSGTIRELYIDCQLIRVVENNLSFSAVSPRHFDISLITKDDDNPEIVAVKFKSVQLYCSLEEMDSAAREDGVFLPFLLHSAQVSSQSHIRRSQTTLSESIEQGGVAEYLFVSFEILTLSGSVLCQMFVPVVHIQQAPTTVTYALEKHMRNNDNYDILRHFYLEVLTTFEVHLNDDSSNGRTCIWDNEAYHNYVSQTDEYAAQIRWLFSPFVSDPMASRNLPFESMSCVIYCHDEPIGELEDVSMFVVLDAATDGMYAEVYENQCYDTESRHWLPLSDFPYSNDSGDVLFPIMDDIHSISLVAQRICESDNLSEQCWTLHPLVRVIQGGTTCDSWRYEEVLATRDPLRMSSNPGCGYKFRRRVWRKQLFFNLHIDMNFKVLHHSITSEIKACLNNLSTHSNEVSTDIVPDIQDCVENVSTLIQRIARFPQRLDCCGRLRLNINITEESKLLNAVMEKFRILHCSIYTCVAQKSSFIIDASNCVIDAALQSGEIMYAHRCSSPDVSTNLPQLDLLLSDYQSLYHVSRSSALAPRIEGMESKAISDNNVLYSSVCAGGAPIDQLVCLFEKLIFAAERQSLNRLCAYSSTDSHYYRNYENLLYDLRACADAAIQRMVSIINYYVKHPYPLDHQQRQVPWSEQFTPLSVSILNGASRLYMTLLLPMFRLPFRILYPPCLHRYIKLSDVICWELQPRVDSVYQWICNLRHGGLKTVLEVHSSRDSYGRVSVGKSPLKRQPSKTEKSMHQLTSVPQGFRQTCDECILTDYNKMKENIILRDEDWCRMFVDVPHGKNLQNTSLISAQDARNNNDGFLLECHRLHVKYWGKIYQVIGHALTACFKVAHEEYVGMLNELSSADVTRGQMQPSRATISKPFSVAVTADDDPAYRESSFDMPVVPKAEIDFVLLLCNVLRDCQEFMNVIDHIHEQIKPPYAKFLENMSASDHTYLRHLAARTSAVESKILEYKYSFAKLMLRGSRIIEAYLYAKYPQSSFTKLSNVSDVHPLFPVPVPLQPLTLPLGQFLLLFYELSDVLHHNMPQNTYMLYEKSCVAFIFRHFIASVFDLYSQYHNASKAVSANLTKHIEKHLLEIKQRALEVYLFLCTLYLHLENDLVSSRFLRMLHVSETSALCGYTLTQWQTAFAEKNDAMLCPALREYDEEVAAWFSRIMQIIALSPKDMVDFCLLQEIFNACDILRSSKQSSGVAANAIVDAAVMKVDLSTIYARPTEIISKSYYIEISSIYIKRSVKVATQNAPLVSRDDTAPQRLIQSRINSVLTIQLVTLSGRVQNMFTTKVLCDDHNPIWQDVFVSDVIKSYLDSPDPVHCAVFTLYDRHFSVGMFATQHTDIHIATASILLYDLETKAISQWHPMESIDTGCAYDIFARIALSLV